MEKLNCVLLVDDDKVNNFITEKIIKKLDVAKNIQTSLNGEEALLFLSQHCCTFDNLYPELILLDNNMPEMDGIEFLESLNQISFYNNNKTKIVLLTGSENPQTKKKAQALGIDAFLIKPLTEEKLLHVLGA